MQSVTTLDQIDIDVPFPFACFGDKDMSFLNSIVNGIDNAYATPTSVGGSLLSRMMVNVIGFLATIEIFMAKVGCLQTYVPGMSYSKYAKLEFVDQYSISHTVFATRSGLGNFNTDNSLIGNDKWKTVMGESVSDSLYFN